MNESKQRIHIEVSEALLEQVDALVDSWEYESRSDVFEQAVREMLGPLHRQRAAGERGEPPYWPVL